MELWLVAVMLLSVRLGFALALAPGFTSIGVPAVVRVLLAFVLAALAVAGADKQLPPLGAFVSKPELLLVGIGAEAVVGTLCGMGSQVILAAFAFAGRLLDIQIGFGIGSIYDPMTRSSANVLAGLMSALGAVLFFAVDAHLALVALVMRSLEVLPLGAMPQFDDPMRLLTAAGTLFVLGLALAAPVVLALLLTDVAVGVASRNLPQLNVLVLSMPLKVLVGYTALAVSVTTWAVLTDRVFSLAGRILGDSP
jgi:flagellar biosynthesis protein FliR